MKSQTHHIEQIASQILYHKKLYYQGKSIISNEEYDALEAELKAQKPNHPVLSFVGYNVVSKKQKIQHSVPMLSLAKTYEKKDLFEFLSAHVCIAMDKFDGMALALEYDGTGKFIQASTRGNGEYGENVTEHIYHILSIPKNCKLSPKFRAYHVEIRGEIYFPLSAFKKFENQFDSFRNAVPGTLGRKDVNEASHILNHFLFYPYDILVFDSKHKQLNADELANLCGIVPRYSKKIEFIEQLGFGLMENVLFKLNTEHILKLEDVDKILSHIFSVKRDHEIDGVIFRVEDEKIWEKMGNTSHHPRGSLAFKRAGETAIPEIRDIEQNVGRSGKISFRAKLKPVFLSNAKISHATLHNADFIEKGHYNKGATVKIIRSGEVIPAILARVDDKTDTYTLPTKCLCGSVLYRKGPDLWCSKKESCEYSNQENLVHFVHVMNMMGVSDKIVSKFRDAGFVKEPADFYRISVDDILELEGFAEKSADNIVKSIQSATHVPLWQFLTALGLKRGGEVKCKQVAEKFKTLNHVLALTEVDLLGEKGWAEKSAKDFVASLHAKEKIIQNLLKYLEIENVSKKPLKHGHFAEKQICITGTLSKSRSEIKQLLESQGAKVVSNVGKNTDFLICNEPSNSSKYQAALKFGTPILTEQELMQKIK